MLAKKHAYGKKHAYQVPKEARVPKEGGQVDPNKENKMAARAHYDEIIEEISLIT